MWSHQRYFQRFRLNVEQYGEILIAEAFTGKKMGDSQPCYDVEAPAKTVRSSLEAVAPRPAVDNCLPIIAGDTVLIEVKSKRADGASVVHCSDYKLEGVQGCKAATHFAVMLFDNQGQATRAWFFPNAVARKLRQETKSKYIAVSSLVTPEAKGISGDRIIDITKIINEIAQQPFSADLAASRPRD